MFQQQASGETPSTALVSIRRMAICCILFFAYLYYWLAGNAAALVQTGLISFAAIAQFAPAFFGGSDVAEWHGARVPLPAFCVGFVLWAYTLLIPSFIDSGWLECQPVAGWPLRHCRPASHGNCLVWSLTA